ncbi:hypothetical protein BC629DRAFT_1524503 [Irpex lacteus]|nr:hypothetical protein BC629DRAFT_1524503 [Irpex lacteus]
MESEKRYVGFMEPIPSSSLNATSYDALVAGTWPGAPVNEITDPGPAALPHVVDNNDFAGFDFNQLPEPIVFIAAAPEENGMVTTESSHGVHVGVGLPADENAPVAQSAAQAALQLAVQPVTPPDVSAACSTAPQENATTVTDDDSSAQRIMPTSTANTQLTPQSVAPTSPHIATPRAAPSINAISQQNATTTAAAPIMKPISLFEITSGKNDAISAYFLGEHVMTHYPELAFTPSARFVCPVGVSYEGKTCQNRKTEPCKTLREWQRAIGRHWASYHYTTGPRFACRNPNCHYIADTGRRGMFFREDPRSKHELHCASVIRARARGEPDPPPPAKTKKTTSRKSKGKGAARATPVASSSGTQAA